MGEIGLEMHLDTKTGTFPEDREKLPAVKRGGHKHLTTPHSADKALALR